jgi:hypothetical protein
MTNGSLPSLATPEDIEARLGRSLTPSEETRVTALLTDGSAIIRRYCREDFILYVDDAIIMNSDGGVITMPTQPIQSITSVTALSGAPGIPDLDVTWYVFDGISKITVPAPYYSGIINLPEWYYEESMWFASSFLVVHDHGFAETPDDVKAVLCTAILSELATPTMSATLASESIGAYSYSMRRTSGAGLNAALLDAGMKTALADYRQGQGTIKVGM